MVKRNESEMDRARPGCYHWSGMKGNKDQNAKQTDCILVEKTSGIDLSCQYDQTFSVAHRQLQKIPRIVCIATCDSIKGEDRLAPFTRLRPLPRHLLVHFLRKGRATARARTSLSESLTGRAARCLAGDRSCAPWPAGLYPSPAE